MKTRAAIRAGAGLLIAVCCSACGFFDVSRDDLIGDYRLDRGFGVESVRLAGDGDYTQLFRLTDEETWTTNSGTWEFRTEPHPEIILKNAMLVDDGTGKARPEFDKAPPESETLTVKKSFGSISLVVDEARGLAFKKLKSEPPATKPPPIFRVSPPNADAPKESLKQGEPK